ncbi:MAG: ABC transporter permease [Candidatus Altiarchaeota archaeon]|nr:ABC transporter permease [Candidatus Altiarchaeota archaeon]
MIEDYLRLALDGIKHRKVRTWLTMTGIFVGIIAVVALISLGQGLQKLIDDQFEAVGGDVLTIMPGGEGSFMAGGPGSDLISAKLHQSDLDVIKKVRGVDEAVGVLRSTGTLEVRGKKKSIPVFGLPTDSKSQKSLSKTDIFRVDDGRYIRQGSRYEAQIGVETCSGLDKKPGVGDKIEIEGHMFHIVGKNIKSGNPFHDAKVTIPIETGQKIFNKTDEYSLITVRIQKGFDIDTVDEKIEEKLRKHRDVSEGEEDFTVETPQNIVGVFKDIVNMVTLVLSGIAGISLIVGGVGIMTTMYTSVLERTKQIGIMKAVGARNSDVLSMFVIEAGLLGLTGGVIGVILGLGMSKIGEYFARRYIEDFSIYVSLELVVGALMFSFIVGCLSGYLPARQASKMHPVDALRYR